MTTDLKKSFEFTLRMSPEDKDFFDKFDRPEKLRELHRIVRTIYKRMHPEWDGEKTIDHIDQDITNNTRSNLRLATVSEQNKNRRQFRNNTSGHTGVFRKIQRNNGKERNYWMAKYKSSKQKTRLEKLFPYTEDGLTSACKYYREVMLADGSKCQVCDPCEEKKSEQELNILSKSFRYEVKFSLDDKDICDKWTRADDARNMCGIAARAIAKRIGLQPTPGLSIDHINQDAFDQRRPNLRLATSSEQIRNQKVPQTNTSGHLGVIHKYKKQRGVHNWVAVYSPKKEGKKKAIEKCFPFTDQGLKDACFYYRNVLRSDGSVCPVCATECALLTDVEKKALTEQLK